MQGTVKWFNSQKGYGFITDSEGKDVFVHHSSIIMDGFRYLKEDDIVNFELGAGNDGREQAVDVRLIISMKVIEASLKEENMYIKTTKDGYGVTRYLVVDGNNALQTDENGMSCMELAEFAGFEIVEKSA
ncbi:MAG: cold shock domain-containing protein [Lachnospiraceae bacterium]|nr:cold shock domain-containing protein [Lachnospiraceae bacterium]